VSTSKLSIDEIWNLVKSHEGEKFETKTGKTFTYEIYGDLFRPSRTKYNISKAEYLKALPLVPFDGPGVINNTVRGPAYVWAILHDYRIRKNNR